MTDLETIRRVQALPQDWMPELEEIERRQSIRRTCLYISAGFMILGVVLTYNLLK